MKTTEIRVRPVIRHAVTRFTSDPARGAGSSECVAEFSHEEYAEEVAEALRRAHRPRQYAIVQRSFDIDVKVYYAESEGEAIHRRDELIAENGVDFRIYERELTDPVAIAMYNVRPQPSEKTPAQGSQG